MTAILILLPLLVIIGAIVYFRHRQAAQRNAISFSTYDCQQAFENILTQLPCAMPERLLIEKEEDSVLMLNKKKKFFAVFLYDKDTRKADYGLFHFNDLKSWKISCIQSDTKSIQPYSAIEFILDIRTEGKKIEITFTLPGSLLPIGFREDTLEKLPRHSLIARTAEMLNSIIRLRIH